jgi:formamidopyrimidine-DNA glycosylase
MPELPDLLHIQRHLQRHILNRRITHVTLRQPVVLRNAVGDPIEDALKDFSISAVDVHGPFLRFAFGSALELIFNLMLAGRIQHQQKQEHPLGHQCLSLRLDDGSYLNFADEQKMMKIYLVHPGSYSVIPGYTTLGIDIRSPVFTEQAFRELAVHHVRKQVRVFLNTNTIFNSIGNAYADEILFEARLHPKTLVASLSDEDLGRLFLAIATVMEWGIARVAAAGEPIHVKVREHMKVRNRLGLPCPRCSTKIRREGVRGYDVFFCPQCQPPRRKTFIDWQKIPPTDH